MRHTRSMQIGFLVLLAVCSAQLAWWMVDQVEYTAVVQQRLQVAYRADAAAATALLRSGVSWTDVSRVYPELVVAADSATVSVSPAVLEQLRRDRFHRLNRYGWEGAFFLAVLLAAMAVVYQALRATAELHQRQELFLAAASHELKSPLASMQLSVETLEMRDPPPARRAELIGRVLTDLRRLERMIGNLLDTARLAAGDARSVPERLVLAEEVAAVLDELRDQAAESQVALEVEVPAELVIHADASGTRSIVRNLLHNGIRAASSGGRVWLTAAASDGSVRLEVRDDGVGFPPHEAPRLFEKFYRVEGEAREPMARGTGLGLHLVRRCVELDGGTAVAESEGPGRGARFTVSWPVKGGAA